LFLIVGYASLPASKNDPLPLEGERPNGGMMFFAPFALQLVVRFGPYRKMPGTVGKLMKRLP
jgi:hypothetical protein